MSEARDDILLLVGSMDHLLEAPMDDPKELIRKLRGVTMAATHPFFSSESALLQGWVATAVDVCTAYVQYLVIEGTTDPYLDVVRDYQVRILSIAMEETS